MTNFLPSPADKTPEQWEALAVEYEVEAIAAQPNPEGDAERRRGIGRAVLGAFPGRRPPITAWLPFTAEYKAIRERQYAAQRARMVAAQCRDYAVLSGIIRATEEAEQ